MKLYDHTDEKHVLLQGGASWVKIVTQSQQEHLSTSRALHLSSLWGLIGKKDESLSLSAHVFFILIYILELHTCVK